jgi:hypothetical protein
MIPLWLVIDTNILVSAALKPHGLQRTVLLLAITKPPSCTSPRPLSRNTGKCSAGCKVVIGTRLACTGP